MFSYINRGQVIEVELPDCEYSVECRYKYDKPKDKYLLTLFLLRADIDGKKCVECQGVDSQYISGNKDNIRENICRVIEQAYSAGFFEEPIENFEYTMKCFDRGEQELRKEGVIG